MYKETLREIRAFDIVQDEENTIVGQPIVFNQTTVLWELADGTAYKEKIDNRALDGVDLSNLILMFNHNDNIIARVKNKTLSYSIDERGLNIKADLSKTKKAREIYEEVRGGFLEKMSFGFSVKEDSYDRSTRTRTILKFKEVYEVSIVPLAAYDKTFVEARSKLEQDFKRIEQQELKKILLDKYFKN